MAQKYRDADVIGFEQSTRTGAAITGNRDVEHADLLLESMSMSDLPPAPTVAIWLTIAWAGVRFRATSTRDLRRFQALLSDREDSESHVV